MTNRLFKRNDSRPPEGSGTGLRRKTNIRIMATTGILSLVIIFLASVFLFSGIRKVEDLEARRNMDRATGVLDSELRALESSSADWAYWTDTYLFAEGKTPGYVAENLSAETFGNLVLSFMAILDSKGNIAFAQGYDPATDVLRSPSSELTGILGRLPFPDGNAPEAVHSGILALDGQLVLTVSRSILKSDKTGPPAGSFIIGRTLDHAEMAKISDIIRIPVSYAILSGGGGAIAGGDGSITPDEFLEAKKVFGKDFAKNSGDAATAVRPLSANRIATYRVVDDFWGAPTIFLKVEGPRDGYRSVRTGVFVFLACLLMAGQIALMLNERHQKKTVLDPILKMERALADIRNGSGGGLSDRIPEIGDDEIAGLARSVNGLLAEVNELNSGLEERVRIRTRELEASNNELEAFASSVSHDLRAPLRVMDGFPAFILADAGNSLTEKSRHYLDRIQVSARRMGDLINALLGMSRVTRTSMTGKDVDLSGLAKGILAELQALLPARRMEFDVAPNMVARGDPALLRTLMGNLLGNALKYTQKNETAHIAVGAIDRDAGRAYFVRDDGAGFDMAYIDKLFLPFQRLHGADEFPGIGIGLATAQRIVARHGGRIWAEAEVGKGATFYFTLEPLPESAAETSGA